MCEEKLCGSMIQYEFRHRVKNNSMLCFYLDVLDAQFEVKSFYKLFSGVLDKMFVYINKARKGNPGKVFEVVPTIVFREKPSLTVYSHILKYLEH